MKREGVLTKMLTEFGSPIQYKLKFGEEFIDMNSLIGETIQLTFAGYQCLGCGGDKKIFRQGYCYDCFFNLAEVGDWILKPELSKAHLGIEDRNLEYEKKMQLQPHIVYLALSSSAKVGVTRKSQLPTRWIDQGASAALEIMEVPNRYLAGITEVALKSHLSDKTNWRRMLKNEIADINLEEIRNEIKDLIPEETAEFFLEGSSITSFEYPVVEYPQKVNSLNITKAPVIEYKLNGIKGQYLIFEDGFVFNVRNNEGIVVSLEVK